MKKKFVWTAALVLFAATTYAQVTIGKNLAWDQPNVGPTEAQSFTYKYYADGSTTAQTFTGVTCAAVATVTVCQAPFPAFTPGHHSIIVTASNAAGESAKSSPFDFEFVVVPSSPANLRAVDR